MAVHRIRQFDLVRLRIDDLNVRLTHVCEKFDHLDEEVKSLDEKFRKRNKKLRKGFYVLKMMELFMRRPELVETLVQYVSSFFRRLLEAVQKGSVDIQNVLNKERSLSCVRELWNLERRKPELRELRHNFCRRFRISRNMLYVLNEIHNVFCQHVTQKSYLLPSLRAPEDKNLFTEVLQLLSDIHQELPEPIIAFAFERVVLAYHMPIRLKHQMQKRNLQQPEAKADEIEENKKMKENTHKGIENNSDLFNESTERENIKVESNDSNKNCLPPIVNINEYNSSSSSLNDSLTELDESNYYMSLDKSVGQFAFNVSSDACGSFASFSTDSNLSSLVEDEEQTDQDWQSNTSGSSDTRVDNEIDETETEREEQEEEQSTLRREDFLPGESREPLARDLDTELISNNEISKDLGFQASADVGSSLIETEKVSPNETKDFGFQPNIHGSSLSSRLPVKILSNYTITSKYMSPSPSIKRKFSADSTDCQNLRPFRKSNDEKRSYGSETLDDSSSWKRCFGSNENCPVSSMWQQPKRSDSEGEGLVTLLENRSLCSWSSASLDASSALGCSVTFDEAPPNFSDGISHSDIYLGLTESDNSSTEQLFTDGSKAGPSLLSDSSAESNLFDLKSSNWNEVTLDSVMFPSEYEMPFFYASEDSSEISHQVPTPYREASVDKTRPAVVEDKPWQPQIETNDGLWYPLQLFAMENPAGMGDAMENPAGMGVAMENPAGMGDPMENPAGMGVAMENPAGMGDAMENPAGMGDAMENPAGMGDAGRSSQVRMPGSKLAGQSRIPRLRLNKGTDIKISKTKSSSSGSINPPGASGDKV